MEMRSDRFDRDELKRQMAMFLKKAKRDESSRLPLLVHYDPADVEEVNAFVTYLLPERTTPLFTDRSEAERGVTLIHTTDALKTEEVVERLPLEGLRGKMIRFVPTTQPLHAPFVRQAMLVLIGNVPFPSTALDQKMIRIRTDEERLLITETHHVLHIPPSIESFREEWFAPKVYRAYVVAPHVQSAWQHYSFAVDAALQQLENAPDEESVRQMKEEVAHWDSFFETYEAALRKRKVNGEIDTATAQQFESLLAGWRREWHAPPAAWAKRLAEVEKHCPPEQRPTPQVASVPETPAYVQRHETKEPAPFSEQQDPVVEETETQNPAPTEQSTNEASFVETTEDKPAWEASVRWQLVGYGVLSFIIGFLLF